MPSATSSPRSWHRAPANPLRWAGGRGVASTLSLAGATLRARWPRGFCCYTVDFASSLLSIRRGAPHLRPSPSGGPHSRVFRQAEAGAQREMGVWVLSGTALHLGRLHLARLSPLGPPSAGLKARRARDNASTLAPPDVTSPQHRLRLTSHRPTGPMTHWNLEDTGPSVAPCAGPVLPAPCGSPHTGSRAELAGTRAQGQVLPCHPMRPCSSQLRSRHSVC